MSSCSIVLFAIRAIVELIFFTPKAPPFEPTRHQPFVGAIIGSNLICMLLHAFLICPEAGEETRGYLHGGLFIDFIGQSPVSVYRLLSFDLLILLIDFIMLGLIIERVKTNGTPAPTAAVSNAETATDATTDTSPDAEGDQPQDHDAEERGILRQEDSGETIFPAHESNHIDEEVEDERTMLLADPADAESGSAGRGEHPMDTFAAGEAVIVNMSFLGTIRDQWRQSNAAARSTSGFVPSPETATFLRQRFGLQVGTDGRIERANVI
ncbi:hypothetical protein DTO013F2_10465 [Penicillium roqueforti]|nr:hypothetical protein DTO013F2_10465 [Penicillium roqueforti]